MGLMKKLTSAIVAASLVFGLVGTAFADWSAAGVATAANRMKALGIVKGTVLADGSVDMALNANITRAQLVTIIVRAFGQGDNAALLKGAPAFTDSASHWASGEIAIAKNIIEKNGFTLGTTASTFSPNKDVSAAEAIAFVMKFLGVKAAAGQTWPMDYIQGALDAGLLSADDKAALAAFPNSAANRGLVFYLADKAFASYKLGNGKTMYTTYVDTTAPVVSVDTYNATTEADSITLTGKVSGAAVLHVGFSAKDVVTPDIDGTWSATVPLNVGANDIWVHALDIAGNAGTPASPVKVTRNPGAAATVTASLAASTVKAGATADLTVKVMDKNGVEITGAAFTVTPDAAIGTFDAATGKFTAAAKPATGNITVTSGAATATVAVEVVAGDLAKVVITPATATLSAGATQKFEAVGQDAAGNAITLSNVSWTASKGIIGTDGTFGATNDAAGTVTVTATSGTFSGTATVSVFGAAAKIALATPANLTANGVSTTNVVATVQDAAGNAVGNYSGNISFAITNSAIGALKSASVAAVNGVATVTLTAGSTVGSAVISASAAGLTGATATFSTAAQVPTSVTATADPAGLAADGISQSTVTLVMNDQDGKALVSAPTGAWTATAASSTTAVAGIAAPSAFAWNGTKFQSTATVTAGSAIGSTNLSFTISKDGTVSAVAANPVALNTIVVGVPNKFAIDTIADAKAAGVTADTTQTVVIRVLDANGNQVTGATSVAAQTYTITSPVLTATTASNVALTVTAGAFANGKATYTVSTLNQKAEAVTYKMTGNWNAAALTSATATGKIVPGVAAGITITTAPTNAIAANGTATATLTAKIVDASTAKNLVTDGSYSVTIKRSSGTAITFADTTVSTVNGVATATVTAGTTVGATVFNAYTTINNVNVDTTAAAATVNTTIIGLSNKLSFGGAVSGTAGTATTVNVNVLDGNGVVNTGDNSTVVTLNVTDPNSAVTSYSATAVGGTASFSLTLNTAGAYTMTASAAGLTSATGGSATIAAADAAAIKITAPLTTLAADTVSAETLSISLVDAYGNTTTTGTLDLAGLVATDLKNSATTVGTLSGWALALGNKTATATFTASSNPGSATVSLAKSGLTSGSLNLNTILVGAPAKLAIAVDADKKVSGAENGTNAQKITVTVLDAAGNRVTGYNQAIGLATTGSATLYTDSGATAAYLNPITTTLGGATFYAKNAKAESVTYTGTATGAAAPYTALGTVSTITGTGNFTPGKPNIVVVATASPSAVAGDGSNISAITAKVTDENGNTVTNAAGTMKFTVNSAYAYLQSGASDGTLSVPVVGGTASVVLQAKNVTSTSFVSVTAQFTPSDSTVVLANPNAVTNALAIGIGDPNDVTAPTVAVTWPAGDTTATLTFSELVRINPTVTFVGAGGGTATKVSSITTANGTVYTVTFDGTVLTGGSIKVDGLDFKGNALVQVTFTK